MIIYPVILAHDLECMDQHVINHQGALSMKFIRIRDTYLNFQNGGESLLNPIMQTSIKYAISCDLVSAIQIIC